MIRAISALMLAFLVPNADAAEPGSLISFERHVFQSSDELSARWQKLSTEKRKDIANFLVGRLGLSSTGGIELIGVYRAASTGEQNEKHGTWFHFRQLDLFGSRLFWSVLIDPDAKSAKVLYHVNTKLITEKPMGFGTEPRDDEE